MIQVYDQIHLDLWFDLSNVYAVHQKTGFFISDSPILTVFFQNDHVKKTVITTEIKKKLSYNSS